MSRVSYVMMNDGGDREMTQAVRQAFNEMAKDAAEKAGIELADILELTVVCNPIMHHLFLGIDQRHWARLHLLWHRSSGDSAFC